MNFVRLSHDKVTFDVDRDIRPQHCKSSLIDEVIVYGSLFVARWYAVIGAFRSSLLFQLLDGVPSWILINQLLCCLIVGIQASGVLIPLSLMMLLG